MRKALHNPVFLSFFLCALLGAFIIVPNIIVGNGIYHLSADFDYQEIPFNMFMNDTIKSGHIFFTWFNDIGSNFIGTFSFYNLFSPFSLLGYLFSSNLFPYLIGPIFILKYGIAGLFSYLYIKRYVKNEKYAIIGSLLYSFSRFQLTNILFYHFHDVVALFPFLLYSLDKLMYEHKRCLFALCIFISAITNWFFFIGECIFLLLYFIIKVVRGEYVLRKDILWSLFIEGLLGCLMAAFVLIPTLFFIIGNPRIGNSWNFVNIFKYNFYQYYELFRAFFFPAQNMTNRPFLDIGNYSSVELYLPVVGMVYVISYLFKKPKDSFSILTIISIVMMFIPILNSSFVLFNIEYYARWFFMPILMMCTITSKAMDEELVPKKGFRLSIYGMILCVALLFIYSSFKSIYFNNIIFASLIIFFAIINMLFTIFLAMKKPKKFVLYHILCIFLFVTIMGNYMVFGYRGYSLDNNHYSSYLKSYSKLYDYSNKRSFSEVDSNVGLIQKIPDIHSYNSNISGGAFEFYKSLGIDRFASIEYYDPRLLDFLGVEIILKNEQEECNYEYIEKIGKYYIYKNNNALSIGFVPSNTISKEEFNQLDYNQRYNFYFNTAILTEKQIKEFGNLIMDGVNISNDFTYNNDGFTIDVLSNKDSFYIIQVPYDKGWTATINGKNIEYYNVDNGLVGIKIYEGRNHIVFKYKPVALQIGFLLSMFGFFIYSFYLCIYIIRKSTI